MGGGSGSLQHAVSLLLDRRCVANLGPTDAELEWIGQVSRVAAIAVRLAPCTCYLADIRWNIPGRAALAHDHKCARTQAVYRAIDLPLEESE